MNSALRSGRRRGWWWYIKFVFACHAAALALWLLAAVAVMPFAGLKMFELFHEWRGYLLLPLYLICAPVAWKYLR